MCVLKEYKSIFVVICWIVLVVLIGVMDDVVFNVWSVVILSLNVCEWILFWCKVENVRRYWRIVVVDVEVFVKVIWMRVFFSLKLLWLNIVSDFEVDFWKCWRRFLFWVLIIDGFYVRGGLRVGWECFFFIEVFR